MTIDEAIEELEAELIELEVGGFNVTVTAVKIGIEALKLLKIDRRNRLPFRYTLLPGETES